jgi:hypothetical protein
MHCGAEITESSTNKQHHLSGQGASSRTGETDIKATVRAASAGRQGVVFFERSK